MVSGNSLCTGLTKCAANPKKINPMTNPTDSGEPLMTKFADFIRNATDEEKAEIYAEVMRNYE